MVIDTIHTVQHAIQTTDLKSAEPLAFYIITVIIAFAVSIISFLINRIFKSQDEIFKLIGTIKDELSHITTNLQVHIEKTTSISERTDNNRIELKAISDDINGIKLELTNLKNRFDNHEKAV